jgi:hypothetical protein
MKHEKAGHREAMELIIGALMASWCSDPKHPTPDEMRAVFAEVVEIDRACGSPSASSSAC